MPSKSRSKSRTATAKSSVPIDEVVLPSADENADIEGSTQVAEAEIEADEDLIEDLQTESEYGEIQRNIEDIQAFKVPSRKFKISKEKIVDTIPHIKVKGNLWFGKYGEGQFKDSPPINKSTGSIDITLYHIAELSIASGTNNLELKVNNRPDGTAAKAAYIEKHPYEVLPITHRLLLDNPRFAAFVIHFVKLNKFRFDKPFAYSDTKPRVAQFVLMGASAQQQAMYQTELEGDFYAGQDVLLEYAIGTNQALTLDKIAS